MLSGPGIIDFLVEQLLQRTTDTLWDKATGWIRGEGFTGELNDAFSASLDTALADQIAEDEPRQRAREVILGVAPIDLPVGAVTPEAPLLVGIAAIISAQVDGVRSQRDDIDGLESFSSWSMLEDELAIDLDPQRLQRHWFEEFRVEVALNRLRGGALAVLATHLDGDVDRFRNEAVLRAISEIHADVANLRELTSLTASLDVSGANDSSNGTGNGHPSVEDVRDLLLARSQRLLDANPLVPQIRVARRLKSGTSLSQAIVNATQPMLLIADAGQGKSVALAEAAINLSGAPGSPLPVVIHWTEAADLPRAATERAFTEAVSSGVFPTDPRRASVLAAHLLEGNSVLLVDGVDEVDNGREQRARFARFNNALRRWAEQTGNRFLLAGRSVDPIVTNYGELTPLAFANLTEREINTMIIARLDESRVAPVANRIREGRLQSDLLLINLTLMAMAVEADADPDPLAYSAVATLIPKVVEFLVAGHWRTDGLYNDERTTDDLLHLAAKAAWNLADGRTVSTFSHRDLVQALDGSRSDARELEDASNLIVGASGSMQFLHRRISDHLLAVHAAEHPEKLLRAATERFWEHSTKYLLHDTAVVATDPSNVLDIAVTLWRSHPPAFDLGLEYCAAVSSACPADVREKAIGELRRASYSACAARPRNASRHNAMWASYAAEFSNFLDRNGVAEDAPRAGDGLEALVQVILDREGLASTAPALEHAQREVRTWLFYRAHGHLGGGPIFDDTFAPTGSVIKPHPDAGQDEFLTLYKNDGATRKWTERKPAPGWLLCHLRPTLCDVNGTDVCRGGWTNRFEKKWYKPFGLRCAWVSAMARDREYVESYLNAEDLHTIIRAANFESSRTHAMLNFAHRYGEQAADDFRWWWEQNDTGDSSREWFINELHSVISDDQVGSFLASIADLLEPGASSLGDHFKPVPSLLSEEWNRYWSSQEAT
ncbi:hypothetical protein ABTX24_21550 [Nocardioides sp. NPDC127514]|uniref:hypothetical protein n=1 Tax=unclassified Nocardioides TaxID=2615069 RepID=UPI00332F5497